MPEILAVFLKGVPLEEVEAFWLWLDGNPNVICDMIDLLLDSHPDLKRESDQPKT